MIMHQHHSFKINPQFIETCLEEEQIELVKSIFSAHIPVAAAHDFCVKHKH